LIALILEDDRTMQESLLKDIIWERYGIDNCLTASSVPEGKHILEENAIDLMLCDVEVIKGTGIDLLRWARMNGYTAECIFLTNYQNFDYAKEAAHLGSIDYVLKTEPISVLEAAIHRALIRINPEILYKLQELKVTKTNVKSLGSTPCDELEAWTQLLQNGEKIKLINSIQCYLDKAKASHEFNNSFLFSIHHDFMQIVYKVLKIWQIEVSMLFANENARLLYRNASNSAFDLLKWINLCSGKTIELVRERSQNEKLTDKVKSYIIEHYSENICRQELADMFFVSSDYLSRIFNKETSMTIPDFITQIRMEEAKGLLYTDLTVSDIAIRVGIDNYSYFSTVFKKYTGMTPIEFRKDNSR